MVVGLAILVGSIGSSRFVPHVDRARAADFGPPARLTVGAPLRVQPIPAGFLGVSLEYKSIYEYAGRNPAAVNPVLVHLIASLSPGVRPQLRIGGDSTDRAWWPERHVRKPLGAYIKLGPRWGAIAARLVHDLNARVILGIDLEANSPRTASVEARKLVAAIGRHYVEALELGNEPELYSAFTWYHTRSGLKVPGRPPSYDFYTYLNEYSTVASALPRLPLAGPAVGSSKWIAYVPEFLAAEPGIRIVTLHKYPLQLCYVPAGSSLYPTVPHLLRPAATTGLADSVAGEVAFAHAHGLLVRIDEINSISCGKAPAVGKSFASALWALQALFAFARIGVDGVNMHSYVGSSYALFRFHRKHGVWSGVVNPEYYGMLLFARAAPPGSRLLAIRGTRRAGVQAWVTRDRHHTTRVVLIDDNPRGRMLAVHVRRGGPSATLEQLLAPSAAARHGVSLDGQTFGDRTTTGLLSGPTDTEQITRSHGAYMVRLLGETAALLTVPTGR